MKLDRRLLRGPAHGRKGECLKAIRPGFVVTVPKALVVEARPPHQTGRRPAS